MPIYEYTCKTCENRFEKLVKSMTERSPVPCPQCGSKKTARTMSVFAVSSTAGPTSKSSDTPGMCGRCGGPGPCAMS